MKKIIIPVLLLMAVLLMPLGIGLLAQQRYEALIAYQSNTPAIQSIQTHIQRGWFHSKITSDISLYLPDISDQHIDIVMQQSLRHGPVLWGDNRPVSLGFADMQSRITLPDDMQHSLLQALVSHLSLLTQLHYDGSQSSRLAISELEYLGNDKTHITLYPVKITNHGDLTMQQMQSSLNWQGMQVDKEQLRFYIGSSQSHMDIQKSGALWTGAMDWHSDELGFWQGQRALQARQVDIKADTRIDEKQRVSGTQSLYIERIEDQGTGYGPAAYTLAINHIPMTVFEKLQDIQQQIAAQPVNQQQQAMERMGMSMFALLPDILAADPEIKLYNTSFTTPDGSITANIELSLHGLNKQDAMNLPKIKQHLRADMQLQLPALLLSENKDLPIDQLLQKGWLIEKNGLLTTSLHMADGMLTINQQAIPLPF